MTALRKKACNPDEDIRYIKMMSSRIKRGKLRDTTNRYYILLRPSTSTYCSRHHGRCNPNHPLHIIIYFLHHHFFLCLIKYVFYYGIIIHHTSHKRINAGTTSEARSDFATSNNQPGVLHQAKCITPSSI